MSKPSTTTTRVVLGRDVAVGDIVQQSPEFTVASVEVPALPAVIVKAVDTLGLPHYFGVEARMTVERPWSPS